MQKVYRLLRNNQETGPYSLEEILLLNLKAFDLVWVDGKSAAWRYPSEIEALKPFVPGVPQPATPFEPLATADMEKETATVPGPRNEAPKKIFVSMPEPVQPAAPIRERPYTSPVIEQKDRVYAGLAETEQPVAKETVQTKYSKNLDDVEKEYTNCVYNQKTKQKTAMLNQLLQNKLPRPYSIQKWQQPHKFHPRHQQIRVLSIILLLQPQ